MENILYIPNEGRIDEIELAPSFNEAAPKEITFIFEGGERTIEIPTPALAM